MQLILVICKVDMIDQICQMLSFCWKLLSAYFALKMITKYITGTKYSSNCKVCMYWEYQRLFSFQRMHASQVGQVFNLPPNFEL